MGKEALDIIKAPYSKVAITEEQIAEIMECEEDPLYFMTNFMKIQHPIKGALPFTLYPFQRRIIKAFVENRFNILLSARQMGKTTCAVGFLLWKAMFTPDSTILVVANKLNAALEIMDRIRFAYENMPNHIRAGIIEYNKGTMTFDNGSKIVARATSSDAGRGLAITLLYADEFSHVPQNKASDFWTSIQPVLSTGGACIITSTPKSDEDQFAQIWKGAIDNVDEYGNFRKDHLGRNGFFATKVPWHEHPDRDEAWAAPFRESLGEARFRQEFENDFITDDETLVNPLALVCLKGVLPAFYTGRVRWYKDPSPNKTYCVALDPCLGTGRDYSAIQVYELPELIQVAEWQHNSSAPRVQVSHLLKILIFIDQTMRAIAQESAAILWDREHAIGRVGVEKLSSRRVAALTARAARWRTSSARRASARTPVRASSSWAISAAPS